MSKETKKISEPGDWQEIPEEGDESDLPWCGPMSWISCPDLDLSDPLLPPTLRLQQEKALRRTRRLSSRLERKRERRLRRQKK